MPNNDPTCKSVHLETILVNKFFLKIPLSLSLEDTVFYFDISILTQLYFLPQSSHFLEWAANYVALPSAPSVEHN